MLRGQSVCGGATGLVFQNQALGLLPFLLIALIIPNIRQHALLPLGLFFGLSISIALTWLFFSHTKPMGKMLHLRRFLSWILLGSSFATIPWYQHSLPYFLVVSSLSFSIRWWLFFLESMDLRRENRLKHSPPCLATRVRRPCILITGVLIPLCFLLGFQNIFLLWGSFSITFFCQWTVSGELQHSLVSAKSNESI
jgi:hypothetical protein